LTRDAGGDVACHGQVDERSRERLIQQSVINKNAYAGEEWQVIQGLKNLEYGCDSQAPRLKT
jgi:hypothetical protein